MNYNINKPWETLDPWQQKYIETEGNCFLLCGRQSGKSTAMSIKFGKRAATKPNRRILMIAFTENQAYALFFKTLMYLESQYPNMIKRGNDKPTKHEIRLKNGSQISCYAAGLAGEGLRHFTLTDLVVDEAAPMSREIFVAVTPMLSVTGGSMDISSTPRGKVGFFYDCSKREDFTKFYVSAEDCPRHKKEFLESEKLNMSKLEYAQEYLAVFLDELRRFFSDELIKKVCILRRSEEINPNGNHYLGCDLARMGEDATTFEIIDKKDREHMKHVENIVHRKKLTTETEDSILLFHKKWNFRKIGLDAGSGTLGVSVMDHLLRDSSVSNKLVALNNRAFSLDRDDTSKQRLMKEDMYYNLLRLLERQWLLLLDDDEIQLSLASIQYEYVTSPGKKTVFRIFGSNAGGETHIVEGLIRSAWVATEDKRLNLWCA